MRTLKFRVWYRGKMIVKSLNDMLADSANNFMFLGAELMQYVGLTDKNGKDGFEGDIVKLFGRSLFVINWDEYYARFQLDLVKGQELAKAHDMGMLQFGEIVGNIYEHPHLLEQGQ